MAIRKISAALCGGLLLIAAGGTASAENAIPTHGKKAIPQGISDQAAAGNLSSFMHTNKNGGTRTGIPRGRSNSSIPHN